MYQTDIAPTFGFEEAARVLGVARARRLWDWYALEDKRRDAEAVALEECLARDASKRNYIVNEELGGQAEWRMSNKSYVDLYRASLNEKGCRGGEFLEDDGFMKWWLKRNPQCRVMSGSGKVMSGWTRARESAEERLARAHAEREVSAEERLAACRRIGERERDRLSRGGSLVAA